MKNLLFLTVLLFSISGIYAQNTAINSNPVKYTGGSYIYAWQHNTALPSPLLTVDCTPNAATFNEVAGSRSNYVQLRVDNLDNLSANVLGNRFRIRTYVDIYFQTTPAADTIKNQELTIDYRPESGTVFRDYDVYKVAVPPTSNGNIIYVKLKSVEIYKWTNATDSVKITASSDPAIDLTNVFTNYYSWYLSAWTEMERYPILNPLTTVFTASNISPDYTNNILPADTVRVSWTPIIGAVDYDVEWTYVDNYKYNSANTPPVDSLPYTGLYYNFGTNSNRVRVPASQTYYTIPAVFERGWLLVRVRGVGRNPADLSKPYYTNWSETTDAGIVKNFVQKYKVVTPHQSDALLWQMNTTYFEQGKRKDVVSYYDGLYRNRQYITKSYEFDKVIVGGSLYDYEGRPALQLMPSPINSNKLKYYANLNTILDKSSQVTTYTKVNFEAFNSTACSLEPQPVLSTVLGLQGPSQYFSPQNFDLTNANIQDVPYIPQAYGYPFTQVEFTNDKTGRIRRQGGVGRDHRLGSTHESKYYYGVPSQVELDRMFGNEVGDAVHYKKNLVIDANGQASVSYLDLKGNVIATALAGNAPTGLDTINPRSVLVTEDLLDFTTVDSVNHALIVQKSLLVPFTSTYSFSYTITAEQLSLATCSGAPICYDCVYDLTIRVTKDDACSSCAADTSVNRWSVTKTIGSPFSSGFNVDQTCGAKVVSMDNVAKVLTPGSYTVTKILKVNESALNAYMADYLASRDANCSVWTSMVAQERQKMDTLNCNITCAACASSLPALNPNDSLSITNWSNCINGTPSCDTSNLNLCQTAYQNMLDDLSPAGQYCAFKSDTTITVIGVPTFYHYFVDDQPLSILNPNNQFPSISINGSSVQKRTWQHSGLSYTDENGQPIYVSLNGQSLTVNQLTLTQFIENFRPIWAKTLAKLHPEYCQYQWCNTTAKSAYDNEATFSQTTTYTSANSSGLLAYPTGDNTIIYSTYSTRWSNFIAAFKKYFMVVNSSSQEAYPINLNQTYTFTPTNPTPTQYAADAAFINTCIKRAAAATVAHCGALNYNPQSYTQAQLDACIASHAFGTGTALDKQWASFRAFYLSLKNEVLYKEGVAQAISGSCYNGCIGNNPFQYTQNGFNTGSGYSNSSQPCYSATASLYKDKRKCFPSVNDISYLNNSNINLYNATAPLDYFKVGGAIKNKIDSLINLYCSACSAPPQAIQARRLPTSLKAS